MELMMTNRLGFSLIEIMLTIMVLALGILSITRSFNTALLSENQINNRRTARTLGEEKMEEIKNADSYAAIDGFASARTNLGGDFADFSREVIVNGDPKEV